ncbi:MAG: hypothetical protein V9E98_10290 [Candidatus Nanopelagicales bacterium]
MSVAHQTVTGHLSPADLDHTKADPAGSDRDFACLVCVTHLSGGADARRLRLVPGVTGVIDDPGEADVHMIVSATGPREAQRQCVERVTDALPQAVVTVPEVVDYNRALLSYLDRHGDSLAGDDVTGDDVTGGNLDDDTVTNATFDDAQAVAELLERA